MPLIQPEKKIVNKKLDLNLPEESIQELRAYAAYLDGSSIAYVLIQLIASLSRDKAFQEWKKTHPLSGDKHSAVVGSHAAPKPTSKGKEAA
jgi:hypothetical protein